MATGLAAPPALSTPNDPALETPAETATPSTLSIETLRSRYEIARTVAEIREGKWLRIALQFPDHMLVDAPRIAETLRGELHEADRPELHSVHILADTSYSACCVDEVAAEHADAQVVVHYGRTCLSPTSRLPVLYVYTRHELDHADVERQFSSEFGAKDAKVVILADLLLQDHVDDLVARLRASGYANILATAVLRDPSAVIPNRRICGTDLDPEAAKTYSVFHLGDPPSSLLLALYSRFATLHVLSPSSPSPRLDSPILQTAGLLRRRFARVLKLASAGVVGILVNTLSVANYLSSIALLREKIAQAGKKSYTVVVGKLNPAKLANFAEIEGWVVVGCWESGLIEDDSGYWRPVVTPFELEVALMSEQERTWGGEWWGGIEKLRQEAPAVAGDELGPESEHSNGSSDLIESNTALDEGVEGPESLPPVFDLRTGRLVSHSRPMHLTVGSTTSPATATASIEKTASDTPNGNTTTLAIRAPNQLASIRGVASPGAEYLRSQRTWQGLGSDFAAAATAGETSAAVEEGRSGIARGYRVGDDSSRT